MTPLEVMKLGYLMRQAQKAARGGDGRFAAQAVDLERRFDDAIVPYLNYAKNMEA